MKFCKASKSIYYVINWDTLDYYKQIWGKSRPWNKTYSKQQQNADNVNLVLKDCGISIVTN